MHTRGLPDTRFSLRRHMRTLDLALDNCNDKKRRSTLMRRYDAAQTKLVALENEHHKRKYMARKA